MAPLLINFRFSNACRFRLKRFVRCGLHNDSQHFACSKKAINVFVSLCKFIFLSVISGRFLGGGGRHVVRAV